MIYNNSVILYLTIQSVQTHNQGLQAKLITLYNNL